MANRFSTSTGQNYVSTYVPEQYIPKPLAELTNLAKQYSDNYKNTFAGINEGRNEIIKINAIDKHQKEKARLIKETDDKLNLIAEKLIKNPNDYNAKLEFNNTIRDFRNNPTRIELENSYSKYNQDLEAVKKLKNYGYWNDPIKKFNDSYDNSKFTPYNSEGVREAEDHYATALDYMKDIAKNSYENITEYIGKDGLKHYKSNKNEEITPKDIENLAYSSSQGYLDSQAGQDFVRKLKTDFPNATESDIQKQAIILLNQAGAKQIFKNTSSSRKEDYTPIWKELRDERNTPPETPETPGKGDALTGDISNNFEIPDNLKDIITQSNGVYKTNYDNLNSKGYHNNVLQIDLKKQEALAKFTNNAQEALGIKAKITSGPTKKDTQGNVIEINRDDLINQFMYKSKTLNTDYKMSSNESESVKNDILQHPTTYTYTDAEGNPVEFNPTLDGQDFFIDRRKYDTKENRAKIKIAIKTGTSNDTKVIFAEPLAQGDKNYHNSVAKIQSDGIKFFNTGEVDEKTNEYSKKLYGDPKTNPRVISKVDLPNKKLSYITVVNPGEGRAKQQYIVLNHETKQQMGYNNFEEMMVDINKNWYQTEQGQGQGINMGSKKTKKEDLDKEDESNLD